MKTVSEDECMGCRRMAFCVYLISGRHFTSAIADQATGKCTRRNEDRNFDDVDLLWPNLRPAF